MIEEFLKETKVVRSFETYRTYGFLLRPFEDWLKTNGKSEDICTYNDIYDYIKHKKEWSNQTKWSFLNTVRQFFKYYRNHMPIGYTKDELKKAFADRQRADLIVDMKYPSYLRRIEKTKKMVLTADELGKFLGMAEGEDYVIIYLLAYFGMRKSELMKITGKNIDFPKGMLTIPTAKTYGTRKLFFNPYVSGLIREYLKVRVTSVSYFNNMLNRYSEGMGITLFPHMFRHTFATEMARRLKGEAYGSLVLKKLLGHTVSDATDIYTDVSEDDIRKAMLELHYMNGIKKREF